MKRLAIHYTTSAVVQFTLAEIEFALLCASNHYDGLCKDAAAERLSYAGNRPGFLRGIHNCMTSFGEDQKHTLTFRELDTMAKILEVGGVLVNDAETRAVYFDITTGLRRAMSSINEHVLEDVQLEQPAPPTPLSVVEMAIRQSRYFTSPERFAALMAVDQSTITPQIAKEMTAAFDKAYGELLQKFHPTKPVTP